MQGDVLRYEAPNVLALKFVMHEALGGGSARSLRSDTQRAYVLIAGHTFDCRRGSFQLGRTKWQV